jgi:hypothetical protein
MVDKFSIDKPRYADRRFRGHHVRSVQRYGGGPGKIRRVDIAIMNHLVVAPQKDLPKAPKQDAAQKEGRGTEEVGCGAANFGCSRLFRRHPSYER